MAAVAWPGRLEVLNRKPLVIVDGAHNGDSAKRMVVALREYFGLSHVTCCSGRSPARTSQSMATAVAPIADEVFAAAWPSARAADPRDVADAFRAADVPVTTFGSVAARL